MRTGTGGGGGGGGDLLWWVVHVQLGVFSMMMIYVFSLNPSGVYGCDFLFYSLQRLNWIRDSDYKWMRNLMRK